MRTRTIYNARNIAEHRWTAGYYEPAERQFRTFENELLRRMDERDELAACKAKAKAWDTFVDDFYRHGTGVDWKAFQNLRRSVGDFRMDVDERPQYQPTTFERIGQYMAMLSDDLKADSVVPTGWVKQYIGGGE